MRCDAMRCEATRNGNGKGIASGFGETERYAILKLWKIA
jgi:hypothetical protein